MGSGLSMFLAPLYMLPTLWAAKGVKWYWAGTAISQGLGAAIAVAWLLLPYAFWKAFGLWSILLWLLPTFAGVMAIALAPAGGG